MGGRGGYGAGAAYDTAPAFDPSPSPVSAPLPLPPPPSNGSAPVPTGPKQRWNTRPTPTSSTLPLPPTSSAGVSPRPAVGALPLSDEEVAAQQARAEREAREERERLEKMAKERELSMLKIQVMKWLPKGVVRVPTGPIADLEAEVCNLRLPCVSRALLTCCRPSRASSLSLSLRQILPRPSTDPSHPPEPPHGHPSLPARSHTILSQALQRTRSGDEREGGREGQVEMRRERQWCGHVEELERWSVNRISACAW